MMRGTCNSSDFSDRGGLPQERIAMLAIKNANPERWRSERVGRLCDRLIRCIEYG